MNFWVLSEDPRVGTCRSPGHPNSSESQPPRHRPLPHSSLPSPPDRRNPSELISPPNHTCYGTADAHLPSDTGPAFRPQGPPRRPCPWDSGSPNPSPRPKSYERRVSVGVFPVPFLGVDACSFGPALSSRFRPDGKVPRSARQGVELGHAGRSPPVPRAPPAPATPLWPPPAPWAAQKVLPSEARTLSDPEPGRAPAGRSFAGQAGEPRAGAVRENSCPSPLHWTRRCVDTVSPCPAPDPKNGRSRDPH